MPEKGIKSLELELKTVVSHHMVLEIESGSLGDQQVLLTTEITSSAPFVRIFDWPIMSEIILIDFWLVQLPCIEAPLFRQRLHHVESSVRKSIFYDWGGGRVEGRLVSQMSVVTEIIYQVCYQSYFFWLFLYQIKTPLLEKVCFI